MGIISALEKRSSLANPEKWLVDWFSGGGQESSAGVRVTTASAMYFVAVYACINILSRTVGSLPLYLYRRLPGGGKEKARNHPLFNLIRYMPNPEMTAMRYRSTLQGHLASWGNAYSYIDWGGNGYPKAIWPIRPDRVQVERIAGKLTYRYYPGIEDLKLSQGFVIPTGYMLHIPGFGFDGVMGYSPIALAREAIGLGMATEEFGARFFGAGTHPGMIIEHPNAMSTAAHANLKKSLTETYSGLGKTHRLMLLEEGMKANKIVIDPKDSQFLECVVPETLISMADGSRKRADELKIKDRIIGWENGPVEAVVSAIGAPPIKPLVKIKTARGRTLTATSDHPCLCLKKFRTPGGRVSSRIPEWVKIGDLSIGNYVKIGLGNVLNVKTLNFEKAWILGALTGDGYIRSLGCSFASNDDGVSGYMQSALSSLGGGLKKKSGDNCDYEIITNGKGCKGSPVRTLLNESGLIGKHSNTKRVPGIVMSGGVDAWSGFLSGYFDTDGSIRSVKGSQKMALYWGSVSRELLEDCQHLLSLMGIQGSIYPMWPGGERIVQGQMCETYPGWGLYVMGNSQLSKLSSILMLAHSQKKHRLLEYKSLGKSRYSEDNFIYDRVVSVEQIGLGETVGIEISGCHTHITNGIVTHNTRKFQINEIARLFLIPPHMIADLERSTNNNIEHQGIEFVQNTMLPWFVLWEQEYMRTLLRSDEREEYFFGFDVDALTRGDLAAQTAYFSAGKQWGWLSTNDIREIKNQNPVEGGDIYMVPLNMIPAKDAGKEPTVPQNEPAPDKNRGIYRNRLENAFRSIFIDAAGRVVRKEVKAIRQALKKHQNGDFEAFLAEFYREMPDFIKRAMSPAFSSYSEAIIGMESELNGLKYDDFKAEMERFITIYGGSFSENYVKSSLSELREAEKDGRMESLLTEWEGKRAEMMANEQAKSLSRDVILQLKSTGTMQ